MNTPEGWASWDPSMPAPTELPPIRRNWLGRLTRRVGYPLLVALELLLFFGPWEFVVNQLTLIPAAFVPPPSQILDTLGEMFADGRMGPQRSPVPSAGRSGSRWRSQSG